MTKTYMQLQKQIAKLQQEAEALRAKEVAGVVERIREAIDHYGLTADDLFPSPAARRGRKAGIAARTAKAGNAAKAPKNKQQPAPPKYTDGHGKTWNGIGKRPGWFVAALAEGKSAKDLEIGVAKE